MIGNKNIIDNIRKRNLPLLKARNLQNNATKDEFYTIKRDSEDKKWKKCKILGSLLDTNEDIKRRKAGAADAMRKFRDIWTSKTNRNLKLRIFNSVVASIFLYNSELWTITQTQAKSIDSYQRRLLRQVINIRWPQVITNKKLSTLFNFTPWSIVVAERRFRWLGHLFRMPENTPAKEALSYAEESHRNPRGRPKQTWLKLVHEDVASMKITWEKAKKSGSG